MAELVDAVDSKSTSSDRVPVQVRIRAPFFLEKYNLLWENPTIKNEFYKFVGYKWELYYVVS